MATAHSVLDSARASKESSLCACACVRVCKRECVLMHAYMHARVRSYVCVCVWCRHACERPTNMEHCKGCARTRARQRHTGCSRKQS